jgi:hypothetical protein
MVTRDTRGQQTSWAALQAWAVLLGLLTLATLFSLRAVWPLMNDHVAQVLPLDDDAFTAVFAVFLSVLVSAFVALIHGVIARGRERKRPFSWTAVHLLLQVATYAGVLAALYPNVRSLYFELLPSKLLQNGVLPISIVVATACTASWLRVDRGNSGLLRKALIGANGVMLVPVLCMGYMAIAVRTPEFYRNSLDRRLKSGDHSVYNHKSNPRYAADHKLSLKPDLTVALDTEYGGCYWVAGDLTSDGQVEIVNLRYYVETPDRNRVSSLAVQDLNGNRLWHWASRADAPAGLGFGRGSSAALVVYDLKAGAAKEKLLMATDGFLFQFDGGTGAIEKSVEVGSLDASDCMIVANLRGKGKKDLLLKDAYHTIWAFDENLDLLWKVRNPGGCLLAHRIAAFDMDDDGLDEVLIGAGILNADGSVRAVFESPSTKLWYGGHVDGIVPIEQDGKWFVGITYCDASGIGLYDAVGKCLWEVTGEHFEYLIGGYFFPNDGELRNQFQLMSKVHYQDGSPQAMINQDGRLLVQYTPCDTAFSVDWTGDGFHELVFLAPASIYGGTEKLFDLSVPGKPSGVPTGLRVADLIGRTESGADAAQRPDGIPDIAIMAEVDGELFLHFYANRNGKTPSNYVYPGVGWEEAANYFTKYYEYARGE